VAVYDWAAGNLGRDQELTVKKVEDVECGREMCIYQWQISVSTDACNTDVTGLTASHLVPREMPW
jgi:hypothetical protein